METKVNEPDVEDPHPGILLFGVTQVSYVLGNKGALWLVVLKLVELRKVSLVNRRAAASSGTRFQWLLLVPTLTHLSHRGGTLPK